MVHRGSRPSVALVWALVCLAATGCIEGAFDPTGSDTQEVVATTCAQTTYEAETMAHSTGGAVTDGWDLWSNGNISTVHGFFPGTTRIDVVASGTPAAGVWPHMVVTVGGQQIGQASVSTTTWQTYSFMYTAGNTSQTIAVAFDNDLMANGEDRNLLVDKVIVNCLAPAPATAAAPPSGAAAGTGTGLRGDYFPNKTLSGSPAMTRTDNTVNFNWGTGSPGGAIGVDAFSVRWTGQVQPLFSETYTFFTISDDGVRLWVNGQQLVNNWTDHGSTENSGTISLTGGQKYDITLEYYENGGGAVAQLAWSSGSQSKQIIPASQLYPAAAPPAPPPAMTGTGGSTGGGGTTPTSGGSCSTIGGTQGWTSRFWDCCKPHCGWSGNASPTLASCSASNQALSGFGDASACSGGSAYMCYGLTPWSVSATLAYGYAATPTGGASCGKCFEIQFTGSGHSGNDPGSVALKGKTLIVQTVNVGGDVSQGQFDFMVPGGGVGQFNACSAQWGVSSGELGDQYGGLLAACRASQGFGGTLQQTQDCLRNKCNGLFTDARGLGALRAGCLFYADWMMAADNPNMVYKEVACPAALVQKSGLTQGGSSSNMCGG